jgi:hypothetical protein
LHVDLELKDFVISFRSSGCSTGAIPGKRAANHAIANRLTQDEDKKKTTIQCALHITIANTKTQ